jgi:hypothetical protein
VRKEKQKNLAILAAPWHRPPGQVVREKKTQNIVWDSYPELTLVISQVNSGVVTLLPDKNKKGVRDFSHLKIFN